MPGGNGTGPMGAGRMTGRGAGYCAGCGTPGYANPGVGGGWFGRGLGLGWRRGRGRGRWPHAGYPVPAETPEQETARLRQQASDIEGSLDEIRNRLKDLESGSDR